MPIEVQEIQRRFIFNGVELPDPNPTVNVEACREIFAHTHPEITTAALDGPKIDGNVHTYEFIRSVGTKG